MSHKSIIFVALSDENRAFVEETANKIREVVNPNELKFKIISLKTNIFQKTSKKYLDIKKIVSIFAPAFQDEVLNFKASRIERQKKEDL